MTHGGWTDSAQAWVTQQGEHGDQARRYILDPAILARIEGRSFTSALDVGCGEGRFCRILGELNIQCSGIDPVAEFIQLATNKDPNGDYQVSSAEDLPFAENSFDLVISYLTLIDIPDFRQAIAEMARVLQPGGTLLIANLTPHNSASMRGGWQYDDQGTPIHFAIDDYSDEWAEWVEWANIRVQNWHRPMSAYMQALLDAQLILRHFDEPKPLSGYVDKEHMNARAPWFNLMEWQLPH